MRLVDRIGKRSAGLPISNLDQLAEVLSFNGHRYPLVGSGTMPGSPYLEPDATFVGYVGQVHRRNGIVAAAVTARALLLSQLQFRWRERWGSDKALYGSPALGFFDSFGIPLPRVLMTMEQHASYAGCAYVWNDVVRGRGRLLAPSRVAVVLGWADDVDPTSAEAEATSETVGYIYKGSDPKKRSVFLPAESVAQWAPEPDPLAWWRGESWVTSVVREITTDGQATDHLAKFYDHAATPNMTVAFDASIDFDTVKEYADLIAEQHAGVANAYRTLALGGGADVTVVGRDLQQMAYRDTQGGHESRVALRSRVPAPILGIREGMQGSALNAGNYNSSRRAFSDGWFSPTADGLCAAFEQIVPKPRPTSALTYAPDRITFLQEDRKDEADIAQANAHAMKALVEAGYTADSVRDAIVAGDYSKLVHSGLYTVQLQAPGTGSPPAA